MYAHLRRLACALALLATAMVRADQSLVQLTAFPEAAVADGHSMVTVTAVVRDNSGHLVSNGTQVFFTTNLGQFQSPSVTTTNGIASDILVAPATGSAGVATITASTAGSSPTPITFEFVKTHADLSAAREYVEIVAPSYMQYAHGSRMIGAAAPHQGVHLRYKNVDIRADDLQYSINDYTVK